MHNIIALSRVEQMSSNTYYIANVNALQYSTILQTRLIQWANAYLLSVTWSYGGPNTALTLLALLWVIKPSLGRQLLHNCGIPMTWYSKKSLATEREATQVFTLLRGVMSGWFRCKRVQMALYLKTAQ